MSKNLLERKKLKWKIQKQTQKNLAKSKQKTDFEINPSNELEITKSVEDVNWNFPPFNYELCNKRDSLKPFHTRAARIQLFFSPLLPSMDRGPKFFGFTDATGCGSVRKHGWIILRLHISQRETRTTCRLKWGSFREGTQLLHYNNSTNNFAIQKSPHLSGPNVSVEMSSNGTDVFYT